MIIDFHAHCFPDDLAPKAVPALAQSAGIPPRSDGTIGALKESMARAEIDVSVVLSIATKPGQTHKVNDWSSEVQDEKIVAFGSIHPDFSQWKDELKRIKDMGIKGIKFHPEYQNFFVNERRMFPIYELAAEFELIMIFHAGVDIGMPKPYHCTPQMLVEVIDTLDGARFVAAHMGGYEYWDDVEKYLVGKNIYFDTSYCMGKMPDEQMKRMILNHGYGKILFATDSPWTDQTEEVIKLKNMQLGQEVEDGILWENAQELLHFNSAQLI